MRWRYHLPTTQADITELRDLIKKAEERYTDLEHRKKLKAVRAEVEICYSRQPNSSSGIA